MNWRNAKGRRGNMHSPNSQGSVNQGSRSDSNLVSRNPSNVVSNLNTPGRKDNINNEGMKMITSIEDFKETEEYDLLDEMDISGNPKIQGCNISKFIECLSHHAYTTRINISNCALFNVNGT